MKKLLIVVDMQNDFITGALGSLQAQEILPKVKDKVAEHRKNGDDIIFTRDTHDENYLSTQEGRRLPVIHCLEGSEGHKISSELDTEGCMGFDKPTFGSLTLSKEVAKRGYDEIELCGLCTDICIVSNALILKAELPETKVTVDPDCCAGVTDAGHRAALMTMKMCQVEVIS